MRSRFNFSVSAWGLLIWYFPGLFSCLIFFRWHMDKWNALFLLVSLWLSCCWSFYGLILFFLTSLKRGVYIGMCDQMKSVCFVTKTVMVRSGEIRPLIPVMNAQELQYKWSCLCQCMKVLVVFFFFFNPCFKLSSFLAPFLQTSAIVGYIIEGALLSLSLYMYLPESPL